MVRDISIEDALNWPGVLVDVRSEDEFAEGTIPGAVNISLLNNEERAMVGTEYKTKGPTSAKLLGLQLVGPKIHEIIKKYEQIVADGNDVVVFCWRGGLRSKIMAQVLETFDYNVYRIAGGYKAYRRLVTSYLNNALPHKAIVLHGLTGVGKTIILKRLAERGLPVLDIESLAVHRGSVYGKVGLSHSPSQKNFEAGIYSCLKDAETAGYVLVECESRRLGRLIVPNSVMALIRNGLKILLYAPIMIRVKRSLEEYVNGLDVRKNKEQLIEATMALSKYLGRKKVDAICQLIDNGRMNEAVEFLLEKYYDPLYKYPQQPSPDYSLSVDTTDIDSAVKKIFHFVTGATKHDKVGGGVKLWTSEMS